MVLIFLISYNFYFYYFHYDKLKENLLFHLYFHILKLHFLKYLNKLNFQILLHIIYLDHLHHILNIFQYILLNLIINYLENIQNYHLLYFFHLLVGNNNLVLTSFLNLLNCCLNFRSMNFLALINYHFHLNHLKIHFELYNAFNF